MEIKSLFKGTIKVGFCRLKTKYPERFFWLVYTLLFLICYELCYGIYFQLSNKTYIWQIDGFEIVYTQFLYAGRWIREVFNNIFIKHTISIPMWDMSLGFGSDIIATNASPYLCLTNPFYLIAAIFPFKYSEFAFDLMIFLKFYFAGVAFCIYSRKKGRKNISAISGSLIYVFASPIYIAFIQPGFLDIFILFPLIMLGVENIWKEEKPNLYIITLTICTVVSIYYTYMIAIFIVGYCIIRLLTDIRSYSLKYIVGLIVKFFLYSIISVLWGGLIAISTIRMLFSLDRLSTTHYIPLFYKKWIFKGIYSGFVSFFSGDTDWVMSFSIVVIISLLTLLVIKGMLKEKIIMLILTISLFIPYIGHAFNGFNYATNRWIFGYAFFCSYVVSLMFEQFYKISSKEIKKVILEIVIYGLVMIFCLNDKDPLKIIMIIISVFICGFIILSKNIKEEIFNKCFFGIIFISCLFSGYFCFAPEKSNLTQIEKEKGTAFQDILENGGKPVLNVLSKNYLTRYDQVATGKSRNSTWLYDISGMDYYYSIYDNKILKFNIELAIGNIEITNMTAGPDRRSTLEKLLGVNHFIVKDENLLPFGFDTLENSYVANNGEVYYLYTRSVPADMIYVFDKVIDYKEFEKEDAFKKQILIMHAVEINEKDAKEISLPTIDLEDCRDAEIDYNLIYSEGIDLFDNKLYVHQKDEYIYLEFNKTVSYVECEMLLENFMNMSQEINDFSIDLYLCYEDTVVSEINRNIRTPSSHMYKGQKDWIINFGKVNTEINSIKIVFRTPGEYSLDGLKVFALTFDEINELMDGLKSCSSNTMIHDNKIISDVDIDKDSIIFISVPYMDGWKAKVDGKETKIYNVDIAFMGIKIKAGRHKLELEYKTPFIKVSIVMGILLWIYIIYSFKQLKCKTKI